MTSILTIGNFDGLHLGHRQLISTTIDLAKSWGARSVAITFTPHPHQFFNPSPHFFIHPENIKEQILESLGLDEVIYLPFEKIRLLTPEAFFQNILIPLDPAAIVLGNNFTFGANKSGNISLLRQMCAANDIALHSLIMEPWHNEPVSSSRIRTAIQTGRVEDAAQMLTAPYTLYGNVEHGASRGHTLGFATANIHVPNQVMPKIGVYATRVQINSAPELHPAVTAVTQTPTFGTIKTIVETHIFDFTDDIYGQSLSIRFEHFIRDEILFRSRDELVQQLRSDCEKARSLLH
ncbi:MAG: riboflavin biosynthesis protein RibF [Proteobacteria bacterium]|nr:riboflavin biosynthesis protein RibF [Pseudomonadota bacterium]